MASVLQCHRKYDTNRDSLLFGTEVRSSTVFVGCKSDYMKSYFRVKLEICGRVALGSNRSLGHVQATCVWVRHCEMKDISSSVEVYILTTFLY